MKKLFYAAVAAILLVGFVVSCTSDTVDDTAYEQIASDKDEEPDK